MYKKFQASLLRTAFINMIFDICIMAKLKLLSVKAHNLRNFAHFIK